MAATLNILRFVPVDLAAPSRVVRVLARVARPILVARYLAGYRRRRPLDPERLAYYEVATAMRALVQTGEARRGRAPTRSSALDVSVYAAAAGGAGPAAHRGHRHAAHRARRAVIKRLP